MSAATLDSRTVTGPVAGVKTRGSRGDAARARLRMARLSAETLERLGARWDTVPTWLSSHLRGQALGLTAYVGKLAGSEGDEREAASLRRLEQRMKDALAGTTGAKPSPAEADETPAERPERRRPTAQEIARSTREAAVVVEAAARAVGRKRTGQAPGAPAAAPAVSHRTWRMVGYAAAGAAIALASAVWVSMEAASSPAQRDSKLPPVAIDHGAHLESVRPFLPATHSVVIDRTAHLVVPSEWLLRPEHLRTQDVLGAASYLADRNVDRLVVQWADGGVIATADHGNVTFAQQAPAPAAATPASEPPPAP